MDQPINNIPKNYYPKKSYIFFLFLIALLFSLNFLVYDIPRDFPIGKIENIEEGINLRSLSLQLQNDKLISSRTVFEFFVISFGGERHILPGDYLFDDQTPAYEIARRITKGDRHLSKVRITIPEGFNNEEIAELASSKLKNFNEQNFLKIAKNKEGYLFPDTYFFSTTDTEENLYRDMLNNFQKKISPLDREIEAKGRSESDIIIMASIIEEEAKGDKDRAYISGILWKRISIGLPLQVDADPTTYKIKGLPRAPISNPGLEAIEAAINPINSPYLYYLHDKDGNIHFARNFEEHKQNKAKYLK